MSTRGTILDTLQTALGTMAGSASLVFRDVPPQETFPDSRARYCIVDTGPDLERQRCASGIIRNEMTVNIVVYIIGATRDAPPTTAINEALATLRETIEAPISLGANVRFVQPGDVPEINIAERSAIAVLPLTINYWYDSAAA